MQSITITFKTTNAAFTCPDDNQDQKDAACEMEIARILKGLAVDFDTCGHWREMDGHKIRDINGNSIGTVEIRE